MAKIGSLGDVTFETSSNLIRTFSEWTESVSARIGSHEIGGGMPVLEFNGPGTTAVDIPVTLHAALGVDVEGDISILKRYCQQGQLLLLMLAGKFIGGSGARWMLESVSVSRKQFNARGEAIIAEVSLALKLARTKDTPTLSSSTITKAGVKTRTKAGVKTRRTA